MHDYLLELGIEEKDIKNITEYNNGLVDYEDCKKNIELLKMLKCTDKEIRNIVIANPNVLIRSNNDIIKTISAFKYYGFTNLNILFDENPFLLNKDDFEIKEYFKEKEALGMTKDDIIDLLESNPYDIN